MKYKCTIYKATNSLNGKVYVGKTKDWPARITQHCESKDTTVFHKALRKYGNEAFRWEVLYQLETDSLELANLWMNSMEIACIQSNQCYMYDFPELGYNMTKGGEGVVGLKVDGSWEKGENNPMYGKAPWNKGKKLSEEHRAKISENHADMSGEKSPLYGHHLSEETKELLRQANLGKKQPEEYKAYMSEIMSGENNPMFQKDWRVGKSEDELIARAEKISKANTGVSKPTYKYRTPSGDVVWMCAQGLRWHPDYIRIDDSDQVI